MRDVSLRAARLYLRLNVKPRLARAADLREAARALDLRLPHETPPLGFQTDRVGGVRGEWARSGSGRTLLYLHGGAYFAGSARTYRPIAAFLASRGFDVFTPSYRLAPRHPFPAALDDARAAHAALAAEARRLALAGDSAGGGLALALLQSLRDSGEKQPAAAALFSPWTDLAIAGASARAFEKSDPLFTRPMLKVGARAYLAGASPTDPRASPLYGGLGGLAPLLIHVGSEEMLSDDSLRLAEGVAATGGEVKLRLWPRAPHGWQLAVGSLAEARCSLSEASDFLLSRF
ncbi:MAG TPA: alpha/beta hydrolase fold domain-containing protein [Methylocystis sp.]|nr:alpha/beta hydrolase fold domain-containing protein [Methylocystis sp.]